MAGWGWPCMYTGTKSTPEAPKTGYSFTNHLKQYRSVGPTAGEWVRRPGGNLSHSSSRKRARFRNRPVTTRACAPQAEAKNSTPAMHALCAELRQGVLRSGLPFLLSHLSPATPPSKPVPSWTVNSTQLRPAGCPRSLCAIYSSWSGHRNKVETPPFINAWEGGSRGGKAKKPKWYRNYHKL